MVKLGKTLLLFLLYFLALFDSSIVNAQKQANIWHFGDGRCLDFSSGAPVNVTGSQMTTTEGCAAYCDKSGGLLFYTNGGGREPLFSGQDGGNIWNRNSAVMYDMQGTEGGGFSAAQSSVIFEAPGQDSVYYVFTMDELEWNVGASPATIAAQPGGRGLSYFTVDMRLNGGLGGVVLADQRVYTPSYEGLCAIRHANGRDYWVLINQDSTGIGIYSVTPSGVALSGVYTASGPNASVAIKASPNGNRVVTNFVVNGASVTTLLSFNTSTGQLSNPIPFTDELQTGEFSPNSRYLYGLTFDPNSALINLKQYDLQSANFNASPLLLYTLPPGLLSIYLQLTANGNILFPVSDFNAGVVQMCQISCPNTSTPGLQLNLFTYASPNGFYTLPNYPAWLFENNDPTFVELGADTLELCGNSTFFTLDAQNPGATYLWSNGATTQTITVNSPGTYSVIVNGNCGTGADEVVVVNCSSPPFSVNCDTSGNWLFFGNYDGGKLNIIVDQNVPNLKIGITTYEPVDVTFSGPFVGNITDVYYAGFNSFYNNNHCGFPISTSSFSGINPALVTLAVTPPVNIISPPNPNNILNQPNGWNTGVICVYSCDVTSYQGGCNTIDQVLDVFQTRFGGSLRGLTVQYCCWSDSTPYRVSGVTGSCCVTGSGAASISYPSGILCSGGGQVTPILQGDPSGTFYSTTPGLLIDPATGTIDLSGSSPGTYPIIYSIASNCTVNLYRDTVVIGNGNTLAADTVNACNSYIAADGTLLTSSGQYIITIPNAAGCDSVIYLTLNISGVTNPIPIIVTACGSYTAPWGAVYTQSGIYSDTLTSVSGCDSIASIDLTLAGAVFGPPINAFSCGSYTAPWGEIYSQSGTYIDTLLSAGGCDSLIVLNLTIGNTTTGPLISVAACSSYVAPNGAVLTFSGFYVITFPNAVGCDSVLSINLTIENTIVSPVIPVTACSNYTAPWGTTYTQSGTYSDTLTTVNGCDSIVTVNLTLTGAVVGPPINASSCGTYTAPWGEVYNQSGTYVDTLQTAGGCDSLIVLNLIIGNSVVAAPVSVTACDSYTAAWGSIYTQSGTYADTLATSIGCDSIISLDLTILTSVTTAPVPATSCGDFTAPWGTTYLQSGTYSDTLATVNGCDSVIAVDLTVYDPPAVQISTNGASTAITAGDSLQLVATGASDFQWSPSTGLSCTDCPSPFASPLNTVTYSVIATDSNGCTAATSITVTVDTRCNDLFVPTIFSPNGTGPAENEEWCVLSNCIATMSLGVYDRWGQLIFETADPERCWNGTKDGKDVPTGVYAFRLIVVQTDGKKIEQSGTVTLTR